MNPPEIPIVAAFDLAAPEKQRLRRLAEEAAAAISGLWDASRKTFWRNTLQRTRDQADNQTDFFPTVTLRCLDALLFFLLRFPEWVDEELKNNILNVWLPSIVDRDQKTLKSSLNSEAADIEGLNLFTLSLYVRTFGRIAASEAIVGDISGRAKAHIEGATRDLVTHPGFATGVSPSELKLHPFILYHTDVALRLALPTTPADLQQLGRSLLARIDLATRKCIERLVAKTRLGVSNPSEAVALGFCAGVLSNNVQAEDKPYIFTAWKDCFAAQDLNGCWPQGRVVRKDKDVGSDRLEITTYEIASVLASSVMNVARSTNESLRSAGAGEAIEKLGRAGAYTGRSIVRTAGESPPYVGWCSDHAYGVEMIESWTSATVLESVLNLTELQSEFDRQEILNKFSTVSPTDRDWPGWLRWNRFQHEAEVDSAHPILSFLNEKIVAPIIADPRNLPSFYPRSMSALLFGPPGTSKTTIAKAVADGLSWPVVLLSPGVFIERGLEYIEAQARSVFSDLMNLSRAIVVFDECDELFRTREPTPGLEQARSITAFVTASMLPKLQDLHDRGKIVFFVCTNNFEMMDPAVKRGGRIDHLIAVGPPDETARRRMLKGLAAELRTESSWNAPARIAAAIDELARDSERFNRTELSRAYQSLHKLPMPDTDDEARTVARKVLERLRPSLTISPEDYETFSKQKTEFSHVVTGGL